jgi:hypothetical protein
MSDESGLQAMWDAVPDELERLKVENEALRRLFMQAAENAAAYWEPRVTTAEARLRQALEALESLPFTEGDMPFVRATLAALKATK